MCTLTNFPKNLPKKRKKNRKINCYNLFFFFPICSHMLVSLKYKFMLIYLHFLFQIIA